jgi:hypothetical protein
MATMSLFLGAGMLAAVFGIFWLQRRRDKTRSAELSRLADTLGMSFFENDAHGLARQLQRFDLFKGQRSKWFRNGKVKNVLKGKVGDAEVYLFDYYYMVSTGKSTRRVTQTVFFANNNRWSLPNFKLKPESWWQKVLGKMGVRSDINFPENPDFSEKFWLTGGMEDLVRKTFGPELQNFLTARPPAHLEGDNYYLIGYKPGRALSAEESRSFFEHCAQLTKTIGAETGLELLDLAELKEGTVLHAQDGAQHL